MKLTKKISFLLCLIMVSAMLLTACGSDKDKDDSNGQSGTPTTEDQKASDDSKDDVKDNTKDDSKDDSSDNNDGSGGVTIDESESNDNNGDSQDADNTNTGDNADGDGNGGDEPVG